MADGCPICRNTSGNRFHHAREMRTGTHDPFAYRECASCGCLSLSDVPDLAPYYAADVYYPLMAPTAGPSTGGQRFYRVVAAELALRCALPVAAVRRLPDPASGVSEPVPHWSAVLRWAGAQRGSAILDVGCGSGSFLHLLRRNGFRDLIGIDPYIPGPIALDGLRIYKTTLEQFDFGRYDVIVFNDSFEHVPDPVTTLRTATKLLRPSGAIVIRTPLADSDAWRTYGVNWVALDAPRHIVVQTRMSMKRIAADVGLDISRVAYDSTSFQFWGSEQYRRDIPLDDPRTPFFPKEQLRRWAREAARLNRRSAGDHASFILRPDSGAIGGSTVR
jgi:SAM-dependent methyltransferase